MTWVFVVLAVVVLGGAFLASVGLLGDLPHVDPDHRPDRIVGRPEFDVVVRGYRMDEVDQELGRLQQEITRLQGAAPAIPPSDDPT